MNKRVKYLLSLALVMLFVAALLPVSAFADRIADNPEGEVVDLIPTGDVMDINRGTVTTAEGNISHNYGTVGSNEDCLSYNYSGAVVENNIGLVSYNYEGARVINNLVSGLVDENFGTISSNEGFIFYIY